MALKKMQNYVPVVKRNYEEAGVGIVKEDQVELTGASSAPTSELSDGRVYYDSTGGSIRFRHSSAWKTLVDSDDSRLEPTCGVRSVTQSITLTSSDSNNLIKCNSCSNGTLLLTLPSAATAGLIYHIVNTSSSAAIGNLWLITTGQQTIAGVYGTINTLDTEKDSLSIISDGSSEWFRLNTIA